MEKYRELRVAVETVAAVDAHAHNMVALDSSFPFLRCFSEAEGDALAFAPDSLSFKRSLRDIAGLYNCEASLNGVENHRKFAGLHSISSKCFEAANISAVFIDDGIQFDKMHDWQWHKSFAPAVGRILRIEHLAETILNDLSKISCFQPPPKKKFSMHFLSTSATVADHIVAMKSVAAYRSGLQIDTKVTKRAAEEGLLEDLNAGRRVRIKNKSFIDYLFTCSLEVAVSFDLPMQIHTGFGDKDLDLRLANPLHLRKVLEDKRFSKSRIVLLHASYPFSKEASYLASVYSQVYLDFGLAVPKLSVQGMISSVKELLELAPIKKVMFSTDGYAFPETFYLGAKKAREVVFSVLSTACDDGDLTIPEAVEAVWHIFRQNALQLYKLNGIVGSNDHLRVISFNSTSKVVPAKRFYDVVRDIGVGLTHASMGMTSFCDGPAEETNLTGVGEIRLIPDLSTKYRIPWARQEEMVLADMHIKPGEAWEYCPRNALRRVTKILKDEYNLVVNAGFENEFYLLKNVVREGKEQWVPFDMTPYCSTSGFDAVSPVLQEVKSALESMDISVEQLHAESGKGQFEVALGHAPSNLAADKLIYTREAIKAIARKHGLLATLLPKYYLDDIGSGCHVHLSLWQNGKNVFTGSEVPETQYGMSKVGEQFMAGVYYHLPSILAFTAPLPNRWHFLIQ
ncbi:protein fluG [Cocos nucifera]|uniref:Protein fluG n=1 Tax=Cocos nucifera TaxID=13894 RepID=A0A8K0IFW9_COCNU|nr:protein fluG [Cocos nucifera]